MEWLKLFEDLRVAKATCHLQQGIYIKHCFLQFFLSQFTYRVIYSKYTVFKIRLACLKGIDVKSPK